jgi:tetratricopeptide (TPR) repeat protein
MKYRKRVFHLFGRRRSLSHAMRARCGNRVPRLPSAYVRLQRGRKQSACTVAICLLSLTSAFAQSDAQFAKANQEYATGDYKDAIADYKALVSSGKWSANLFYNLGNAYFRIDDFGRSILNYERALALERHHPEARANLALVRDDAHALELAPNPVQHFLEFATAGQYAIAAAVGLWFGLFCIAKLIFASRRSRGTVALALLSLLIFAASVFAAYWIEAGSHGQGLAIVTGDDVQARLATADTSGSVLALPSGSEIRILRQRGDWIYAALPNDLRGWIPEKSAERVRL